MSSSSTWRARLIGQSDLFDRAWYLRTYPDVARAGEDPVQHWIRNGVREGRDPGPRFRTGWYLEAYPDVAMAGENPLVHHLVIGRELRRKTRPGGGGSSWWQPLWASEDGAADVSAAETAANPEPTAIIIPAYNAPEELSACIATVLHNTWGPFRLILIDDASPDPKVAEILRAYAETPGVEVHCNPENLGFTRTINRGIELAGRADVVFLNSDTEVPPNWLRNLRLAAYARARVGSVSPFSNNAGAFSAPVMGESNPLPDWLDFDALGRVATQGSLRLYPEVPTNHGFCMYVRRDCLDEMGGLDAEAFPRGYGEENEFCMRAGRAGWIHLLDDATLVYHVRSASFGDAKTDLLKAGRELVDARYPEYESAISAFSKDAAIRRARQRLGEAIAASRSDPAGVLPRVLYVVSTRTGGTPQTNQDLMSALSGDVETLLLRCDSQTITLQLFREGQYEDLETHRLSEKLQAFPHRSAEYDSVVRGWLIHYAIELVHIRHIGWHGLGLVETAKTLELPVVFSFHDFYTVCPTVKLLDDELRFCGGRCTASAGECRHELWPATDFPPLKNAAIHDWQAGFAAMLRLCDAFVTTTRSTRETMVGIYPFLAERPFEVIPHGRDLQDVENLAAPRAEGEPLRLLVPGNITIAKGGGILQRMAEAAPRSVLEIHVLGPIVNPTGLRPHVVSHGAYRREEFQTKVAQIRPHMGAVFSIWPETYCHTLTEMWSCGLPVAGLDRGAVGDRIRASGAGWALPQEEPAALLARLLEVARDPKEMAEKTAAVRTWQETEGVTNTTRTMAGRYFRLYGRLAAPQSSVGDFARLFEEAGAPLGDETVAVACPCDRLTDGCTSTHVRVRERTRNRLGAPHYYQRVTPREIAPMARMGMISKAIVRRNAIPAALEADIASLVETGRLVTVLDIDDNLPEVSAERNPKGASHAEDHGITAFHLPEVVWGKAALKPSGGVAIAQYSSWSRTPLEAPEPQKVDLLEGARVFPGTMRKREGDKHWGGQLLLDNDFNLVCGSYSLLGGGRSLPQDVDTDAPAESLSGNHFFLGSAHRHFGHFLLEGLARVWAWRDFSSAHPDGKCIIYEDRCPKFVTSLLRSCGIDENRTLFMDRPLIIERLHVPTPSMRTHRWIHHNQKSTWRTVADTIEASSAGEKLYLSRRDVANRALRNEAEIEDVFSAAGYLIIKPEKYSVTEQIALAKGARSIAGTVGSQLYLAAFQQDGARNLIMAPSNFYLNDDTLISSVYNSHLFLAFGSAVQFRQADRSWTIAPEAAEKLLEHVC